MARHHGIRPRRSRTPSTTAIHSAMPDPPLAKPASASSGSVLEDLAAPELGAAVGHGSTVPSRHGEPGLPQSAQGFPGSSGIVAPGEEAVHGGTGTADVGTERAAREELVRDRRRGEIVRRAAQTGHAAARSAPALGAALPAGCGSLSRPGARRRPCRPRRSTPSPRRRAGRARRSSPAAARAARALSRRPPRAAGPASGRTERLHRGPRRSRSTARGATAAAGSRSPVEAQSRHPSCRLRDRQRPGCAS